MDESQADPHIDDHRYIQRYDRRRMTDLLRRNEQLTGEKHGLTLSLLAHAQAMDVLVDQLAQENEALRERLRAFEL